MATDEPRIEATSEEAAEGSDPALGSGDRGSPPRAHRSGRGPWVWSGVAIAVLVVLVLFLATSGFTVLPWSRSNSAPPGTAPGGGGGSGDDEGNTTILSAGTTWALGTHQFRAVWFEAAEYSGIWGNVRSTGSVYYFLVAASNFTAWAGGNETFGSSGNLTVLAHGSNWSRTSAINLTLTDVLLGPGVFDLVAADNNAVESVEVSITSTIYEEPFDTS